MMCAVLVLGAGMVPAMALCMLETNHLETL